MRRALTLSLLGLVVFSSGSVAAEGVAFGPHDGRSAFYVAKSENQNQVHYAVRLDALCRPLGKRPVFAYWRRLRQGKRIDAPLVGLGTTVYGAVDEQKVTVRARGGSVWTAVKALKQLRIRVDAEPEAAGCKVVAYASIKGQWSRLSHAFLQLRAFGLSVKYVDVIGYRVSDGARMAQRID